MKIGFCVSGNGHLVESILHASQKGLVDCTGSIIFFDRPSRLKALADELGFKTLTIIRSKQETREQFRKRISNEIISMDVTGLFLTFNWVLPYEVIRYFNMQVVNLHMSLLPLFPGFGASRKALEAGMKIAGVTYHKVDDGIDTGPIIAQAVTEVFAGMTEQELGFQQFKAALPLGIQVIRWWEEGLFNIENNKNNKNQKDRAFNSGPYYPAVDRDILDFANSHLMEKFHNN